MKRVLICCSAMFVVASCSTLTAYAAKADLTPKAENKFVMKLTGLALEPSASNLNYAVYKTPLPLTTREFSAALRDTSHH